MSDTFAGLFNVRSDLFNETFRAIQMAVRSRDRLKLLQLGLRTVVTEAGDFGFTFSTGLIRAMDADPGVRPDFITWVSILSQRVARMTPEERLRLRDRACEEDARVWKETMSDKPLSCRKGCAFCCHVEVQVTRDEAEVLAGLVREGIVEIDADRLSRQVAVADFERGQTVKEAACVFLTEHNTCGVYEHRPMACRVFGVATPAELCDREKYPDYDLVAIATSNKIEILQTALRNVESGSLPKMLTKELLARQAETLGRPRLAP